MKDIKFLDSLELIAHREYKKSFFDCDDPEREVVLEIYTHYAFNCYLLLKEYLIDKRKFKNEKEL